MLRQFHQGGFVNQFAMKPPGPDGSLIFGSEALENVPAGWSVRIGVVSAPETGSGVPATWL